ncbi:MAG: YicC family protein, partial [Clostridiales Family XIII bacterium]|nr:YicC family protein [Clostridiales Family XIII bacterium]
MIRSMTGFGRGEASDGVRQVTVEIRSVNHRYGDISAKLPRRYAFAEDAVKRSVRAGVSRGKTDVTVGVL